MKMISYIILLFCYFINKLSVEKYNIFKQLVAINKVPKT